MRSRSSSPSLEDQRYDLTKRSELKIRTPPPRAPPVFDTVDSKNTCFNDDDRLSLNAPYALGSDTSNEHITAVVNVELSSPSENSPYMSDEASTSSLSSISLTANDGHDSLTLQPGRLYATKNSTVLIIRRRTSFFSLDVLSKSSPNSGTPSTEWKTNINNALSAYSCGPCVNQNSTFEKGVKFAHKKYEKELKGEGSPLDVRVAETRSVTAEESWRKPVHDVVYPVPSPDGNNVVGAVEVF